MKGPRDEDLDVAIFDDQGHEARFGFALNKAHEIYDRDEVDQDDDVRELEEVDETEADAWLRAEYETYRQEHDNA